MKEIKLSDLRIGNWVQNNFGTEYQVKAEHILMNHQQGGFFDRPIPITEEWLLRFGFNKVKLSSIHNRFDSKKGFSIIQRIVNNQFWYHDTKIESVHHLQNVFHALTGEELTINN